MKWKVWNLKRRTNPAGLDWAQGSAPSAQSAHQCSVNAGVFSCLRAEEEEEQLLIKVSLAPRLSGNSSGIVGEKKNKVILTIKRFWPLLFYERLFSLVLDKQGDNRKCNVNAGAWGAQTPTHPADACVVEQTVPR